MARYHAVMAGPTIAHYHDRCCGGSFMIPAAGLFCCGKREGVMLKNLKNWDPIEEIARRINLPVLHRALPVRRGRQIVE